MAATGALFSDLFTAITERGRSWIARKPAAEPEAASPTRFVALCENLLSGRGEASGTARAAELIQRYEALDGEGRHTIFRALLDDFGPDKARLAALARTWLAEKTDAAAAELHFSSEPRRQELLRRVNRATGGTKALVAMRADLLAALRKDKTLAPVDRDFAHLLSSWFNRGFLVLRRSIGRRPPSCSRRSSVTRRCTRSATFRACAYASIRPTDAATASSIRRCLTSR